MTDAPTFALPVGVLLALREALLGTDDGEARLRDAGFAAGDELYDDFASWLAARAGVHDPAGASMEAFIAGFGTYVAARGWGSLTLVAGDATESGGLPSLCAEGWFEAQHDAPTHACFPTCHFTTGMLAGFLSRLAGQPLAVLELACASTGEPACRFVIGSADALARLHAAIYHGRVAAGCGLRTMSSRASQHVSHGPAARSPQLRFAPRTSDSAAARRRRAPRGPTAARCRSRSRARGSPARSFRS